VSHGEDSDDVSGNDVVEVEGKAIEHQAAHVLLSNDRRDLGVPEEYLYGASELGLKVLGDVVGLALAIEAQRFEEIFLGFGVELVSTKR
jgi:hypothetical protein